MIENEKELRDKIVVEALSWLRTPYHVSGELKGVGVDCERLLTKVYSDLGLIEYFPPVKYSPDFLFHRSEEFYLNGIEERAYKSTKYDKGNIILYKMGRVVSHSAIIVDYPTIIHAASGKGCILDDASQDFLKKREYCVFSLWEDK
jgi:cell wall-associated NlpC family hydrolase